MATRIERLPSGARGFPGGSRSLVGLLVALIAFGAYAYSREVAEGMASTGLRNVGLMGGATWGLYVVVVLYLSGVAFAAITLAVLAQFPWARALRPVARMAQVLAVVAAALVPLAVLVDLGQPLRGIVNLLRYARPQSPFFGTFALVISGYLLASVVYLYLNGRRDAARLAALPGPRQNFYRTWAAGYSDTAAERQRHDRVTFWLGVGMAPLLVAAASTLGLVFGLQVGRPGWFSALQAPAFVLLGGASGIGLLIVIAAIVRRSTDGADRVPPNVFRWLGGALLVLLLGYLYFMIVEILTAAYSGHHHEVRLTRELLSGTYAPLFWTSVALFVATVALLVVRFAAGRTWGIAPFVVAGILANCAILAKRYLVVVPSQTHGTLLPYAPGSYSPAWTEYAVVVGLLAIGTLGFIAIARILPTWGVGTEEGNR